jgi:hypothetical protein
MILGQALLWPSIFFIVWEIFWDAALISPHPNPLPEGEGIRINFPLFWHPAKATVLRRYTKYGETKV